MNDTRVTISDESKPDKCAFCGKVEELRPYGPNDERICFDCAMKDEKTTERKFLQRLNNCDVYIIK